MFVAASTECFHHLPFDEMLERLVDLEYSGIEVALHAGSKHLTPQQVADDLEAAIDRCRNTRRLDLVAFSVQIDAAGEEHYRQFTACCRLAKATKVVTMAIPSAEVGTPFNQEVEHLQRLAAIASVEGVVLGIRTEVGRLAQDPATIGVLCENVKGLGVTLDPSHFIYGGRANVSYDKILKYVCHVRLRDTTRDQLQVRVGQGAVEYGKLINQLRLVGYARALCVHITPMPEVDHMAELRKMRLLLESLL